MVFAIGYFQPALIRNDFYTVYWFNKELARIVYSTKEKPLGLGKLDFWQESVENLYKAGSHDPGRS
jgi:phytoene/squalene synthetase